MSNRSDKPYITPFVVIIDTREQAPFLFTGHRCGSKRQYRPMVVRTVADGLRTGDYSLEGFKDRITIERKSLSDAYSTFSHDRDRFERELLRMAEFENSFIVIEADWPMLLRKVCSDCCGLGKVFVETAAEVVVRFERKQIRKLLYESFANVLRSMDSLAEFENLVLCERCQGTGALLPTDHSKFLPKAFFETVMAWKIRFPMVHWEFCYTRAFAEKVTLRALERFWNDEQDRLKRENKETTNDDVDSEA